MPGGSGGSPATAGLGGGRPAQNLLGPVGQQPAASVSRMPRLMSFLEGAIGPITRRGPMIDGMEFSYADVRAARPVVERHLPPTPMWSYPVLDRVVGTNVLVKHENVQPVGAFKVRGGVTLLDRLTPAERERGTVTYSTGNHALSMAYASSRLGVPCTVVMPAGANPAKAEAVRAWAADVVLTGADLAAAQTYAEQFAESTGARLVSPGDTPELLAGVGTLYQEILIARPDLAAIVVPVGSGTGAAAATVVARELAPACAIIAVQSASSPAAHDSWRSGELLERPNRNASGRDSGTQHLMIGPVLLPADLDDPQQPALVGRLDRTGAGALDRPHQPPGDEVADQPVGRPPGRTVRHQPELVLDDPVDVDDPAGRDVVGQDPPARLERPGVEAAGRDVPRPRARAFVDVEIGAVDLGMALGGGQRLLLGLVADLAAATTPWTHDGFGHLRCSLAFVG